MLMNGKSRQLSEKQKWTKNKQMLFCKQTHTVFIVLHFLYRVCSSVDAKNKLNKYKVKQGKQWQLCELSPKKYSCQQGVCQDLLLMAMTTHNDQPRRKKNRQAGTSMSDQEMKCSTNHKAS